MDLKNFDKQIKSSLENLDAPYDAGSWFALENRMNASLSEEQPAPVEPVDLVVKRSLERLEAPYQASHWNLLNARLNQIQLVRRIRTSKIAEVAIFLLLLINIEGFLGGFKEVLKPTTPELPKASVPMANVRHPKKHKSTTTASTQNQPITAVLETVASLMVAPFQLVESELAPGTAVVAAHNIPATAGSSYLDATNFYGKSGMFNFKQLEKLPQTKTADFAWKNFFETIPGVITPNPRKSNGFYVASYASLEKNHFNTTDFSEKNSSFGGGIAVGRRKGKWGIESGLAYSNQQFSPKKTVETYAGDPIIGFIGAYVADVNADVFAVPVKVSRRFARVGNATAHLTAGVTAHVATQKGFGYKSVVYPPNSPDPTPLPGPDVNTYPIPKKGNKGLLEGGSLRGNAYASADIGVRIEKPIGKRHIAFVEPAYRRSLGGGFGPNKEKVNTFAFQAGVMAAL